MPNRKIYLVRHGKAEPSSATGRDFDRCLTGHGKEILRAAARGMVSLGVEIDLLVSSPLVRAVETADELASAFAGVQREVWDELACGVDEIDLAARIDEHPRARGLMLVGHEPDIGEMISFLLTGKRGGFLTHVRTGNVACLTAGATPPGGRAVLEWVMTADQLGGFAD
jgi:phosphohistidine phosphatase